MKLNVLLSPEDKFLDTKLYFFECGTLKSQKHLFTLDRGIGEPFEVPVLFFLIRHKGKNILFDTGNALGVAKNPEKHWGEVVNTYYPIMKEEQFVVNQLRDIIGIQPEEVDYVILSHLHLDHAGGVGAFPNALYIAHEKELECAFDDNNSEEGAYIMEDIGKEVKWLSLDIKFKEFYDLFDDGAIKIFSTPGHTPGHLSVLINLKDKPLFLASDSCYTQENLNEIVLPGFFWDAEASKNTITWIKELRDRENIGIVTGHDPKVWTKFKKAPEFYV